MTRFRGKEGDFLLTAQRPCRRVPVFHRIPLFSRTRMRVRQFLSGSRICHKISRFYLSRSKSGCLYLSLNATHWAISGIEVGKSCPEGNLAASMYKACARGRNTGSVNLVILSFPFFWLPADAFFAQQGFSFLPSVGGIFPFAAPLPVLHGEKRWIYWDLPVWAVWLLPVHAPRNRTAVRSRYLRQFHPAMAHDAVSWHLTADRRSVGRLYRMHALF